MAQEVSSSPSTSCKFLLSHQDVPLEELLGSVTTYNSIEGSENKSLQLRQSARVFKKMRLDSAAIAAATSESSKAAAEELEKAKEDKLSLDTKKPFRPLWLPEDKTLFFEALNEHGKDFEAIHSYMKLKKKGAPENAIKTREQIRHLYHRTWHKISKHLIFSEDVKKVAQELYGLINYGELRKKLVSVSPKTTIKLNELIYRGSMTLRVKGKTIRIKTPMCRALRRLNQLDEKHDDIKLPTRILVELKPKDMATWMHVQEMSQNPRVRTAVPLQKRLSTIIQCMSDRWKTQNSLDFDRMLATLKDTSTADLKTQDNAAEEYEDKRKVFHSLLRLSPPDGAPIHIPNINLSEMFTSHTICMNAYERRVGVTTSGEALWLKAFPGFRTSCKNFYKKAAAATKRQRSESGSAGTTHSPPNKITSTTAITSTTTTITTPMAIMDNNENNLVSESGTGASSSVDDHLMDEYIDHAVNTILALQTSLNGGVEVSNESANDDAEAKVKMEDDEQVQQLEIKRIQNIEKVKLGWTIEDCGTLSIGDLYLMFGTDSKLELEYSFHHYPDIKPKCEPIDITSPTPAIDIVSTDHPHITDSSLSSNHECHNPITIEPLETSNSGTVVLNEKTPIHNDLSATLKRLLSVAKLHYRRNIVRCPCGHVCNGNANKRDKQEHQRQVKGNFATGKTAGNSGGRVAKMEGAEMVTIGTIDGIVEGVVMETVPVSTSSIIPITIQPMIKRFQPNTLFRRPNSPNDCLRAQIDSIQRLKPRYCNRMGRRVRTKQMVVERKLPLLPNINESGRQIVQMNIISQDNNISLATSTTGGLVQPRNIAPKMALVQQQVQIQETAPQQQDAAGANRGAGVEVGIMTVSADVCEEGTSGLVYDETLTKVNVEPTTSYKTITSVPPEMTDRNGDNATTPSRVCSPTSISNLLDIALNSAQNQLDSERKGEGSSANITSFQGLISQSVSSTSGNGGSCTPPDSPSRLLKDAESQQWLNSEVADYSLSSLLGHLESPMKTAQSGSSINGDDTRLLSHDVDVQLQSLLTESSLDYTAKFADLAAQVSDSKNKETFGNT